MRYILIQAGELREMTIAETDAMVMPDDTSAIHNEPEWVAMCEEAGGEAALIESLGVKDMREADYAE